MDTHARTRVASSVPKQASRLFGTPEMYKSITKWSLYLLAFLVPLFFLPWSIDILEVNKQTILIILTFIAALSWLGGMVVQREVSFRRGWINLLPLVFLVAYFVSTILSLGGYSSWVGTNAQEYMSFLSTAAFVVLFYVILNNCSETKVQKNLFFSLILSSTIAIIVGTLHTFGLYVLPFDFAKDRTFNTIGTVNSLGMFAIFATVVSNAILLSVKKEGAEIIKSGVWGNVTKALMIIISIISIILLAAVDYQSHWIVLLLGLVVVFTFPLIRSKEFPQSTRFILPMILFVVALILLFVPTPLRFGTPAEVTPSFQASWNIARDSLSDTSALFGSGPGTFVLDYAKYHPESVNNSVFWSVRFDRANIHVLTILATLGVVGLIAWLAFVVALVTKSLSRLIREREHDEWKVTFVVLSGLVVLVLSKFFYSSNFTLEFIFWFMAALLASQVLVKVKTTQFGSSPRLALLLSFVFVLIAIATVGVLFITGQRYVAEVAFAQAVKMDRSGAEIQSVVEKLDQATSFNPYNDSYYRNFAHALLTQVKAELAGVTELAEDKAQLVSTLSSSSINAAKRATDLEPNNVANWLVRASIYREYIGLVNGADAYARASLEQAISLEPTSPVHHTELGKVYIQIAEIARQQTDVNDEELKAAAETLLESSLTAAEESLNNAIALKADYAPAHYWLAIVFERQGRLDDAVTKMESVKQYNPLDVGVAFQLGLLYLRQERTEMAQVEFERVINLVPTYSNARWFLASIYEVQGEIEKAIEQVQAVYDGNPDNELVAARLQRLQGGEVSEEIQEPVEEGEGSATDVPEGQPVVEE